MNIIRKTMRKLFPAFLGGDLVETRGSVRGEVAVGVTADLMKATGELRVHLVRSEDETMRVVLDLPPHEVPGDSASLFCLRLDAAAAARLGAILGDAARAADAG